LEINGGQNLIKDYYELGTSLPASFYTYENCVELFEILQNDITPKTNELVKNPLSDTVLIDNVLNNKVKNYLLKIKEFYSSQSDKDKAQKLITKLDFFTNKSNKFITNNLYLY
jgi:aspartyl/asparaginyl-tRNA synthetase